MFIVYPPQINWLPQQRGNQCDKKIFHEKNADFTTLIDYHGNRASMAAFRQRSTHGQKFDPESLYEPI